MTHRVRWLLIGNIKKINIEDVAKKIKSQLYSENKTAGFRLLSVDRSSIIGEFIERFEYTEVVENPLGGEGFTYTQTRFRRIRFTLNITAPHLELLNPPSGINDFINVISALFDFSVTIFAPDIDIDAWSDSIKKKIKEAYIDRIKISQIQLSETAIATTVVVGTEDVRSHADKICKGKGRRVDLLRMTIPDARFEISRMGSLSSEVTINEKIVKLVRDSLVTDGMKTA